MSQGSSSGPATTWTNKIASLGLSLIVIAVAVSIAVYWMNNKPKAQRRKPEQKATLVETVAVQRGSELIVVDALGTVVAARQVQISPQVSGTVAETDPRFAPGGFFKAGDELFSLERADYELVVEQRKADVARAESTLQMEMGSQDVAVQEYELLGQDVSEEDKALLLRKPQLAAAQAAVASARAALEKAKLDLARTTVRAPFNSIVQETFVERGARINAGSTAAVLVGTDEYWLEVSVPVDELKWLQAPDSDGERADPVRIFNDAAWGAGGHRQGEVRRLMAALEPQARMARLLVVVDDPLDLNEAPGARRPLLLGSFVRVEIEGRTLEDVAAVPRSAVRDRDTVWILTADRKLEIRSPTIAHKARERVLIAEGLGEGEFLIVSDLAAPVAGMPLRTLAEGAPRKSEPQAGDAEAALTEERS